MYLFEHKVATTDEKSYISVNRLLMSMFEGFYNMNKLKLVEFLNLKARKNFLKDSTMQLQGSFSYMVKIA